MGVGLRRIVRLASTLIVLAGVVTLGWAVLTWRWEDPFTSIYTALEQRELAKTYERRAAEFARRDVRDVKAIRGLAKRYRETSGPGDPIGRITIPRVGLNMIVVNGTA